MITTLEGYDQGEDEKSLDVVYDKGDKVTFPSE